MQRTKHFFIFTIICLVLGSLSPSISAAWGKEKLETTSLDTSIQLQSATAYNSTVPSRTPVPPPTNTPGSGGGGSGGGGGNNNPPPATAVPATPTTTFTPSPVPLNINLEECADPAFVADLGTVNVRSGPGVNYEVLQRLEFAEIAAISGRAQYATWWRIDLENNVKGWVADETGTVFGNTSLVNIVPPPAVNGSTPTPGPVWNPTPNPQCPTATPTNTPPPVTATSTNAPVTATPSPTIEETAVAVEQSAVVREVSTTAAVVVTATPSPTSVSMVEVAVVPTNPPATTQATSVDLITEETQPDRSISGYLIIGFGLIILGFVIAGVRRMQK